MRGVKVPLSAGATLPRDLREWATWANNASAPHIRSDEATGYNVGEGVWFGRDTDGIIKMFVGDAAGNKVTWDGTTLSITGAVDLQNAAQTFAPEWSVAGIGPFSVDPTGNLSYLDLGRLTFIYTTVAILGTSDDVEMSILNLPIGAKPPAGASGTCMVVDNGSTVLGNWTRTGFSTLTFGIAAVSGTKVGFSTTGFTNSGQKGLPAGWAITYAQ
jgi:hypothetical protein